MAGNRKAPKRGSASESRYSLMEFTREFPDDEACLVYLWKARYAPDGTNAACPRWEMKRPFRRYHTAQQRQSWACTACGLHLHPTAGTIFHKSSTALHLWFYAIYLITSTRCGISAKQLEREIGVGYKTAWRMFNLIRNSLMAETPAPLSGKVEMDETYFSKSRRLGMPVHSGLATDERTVFAMVERKGNVVARHVGGPTPLPVEPHITEFVMPASTIYTDFSNIYQSLPKRGYQHRRAKHSTRLHGVGDVTSQTIEGFFSLLKSGIR